MKKTTTKLPTPKLKTCADRGDYFELRSVELIGAAVREANPDKRGHSIITLYVHRLHNAVEAGGGAIGKLVQSERHDRIDDARGDTPGSTAFTWRAAKRSLRGHLVRETLKIQQRALAVRWSRRGACQYTAKCGNRYNATIMALRAGYHATIRDYLGDVLWEFKCASIGEAKDVAAGKLRALALEFCK